MHLLQAAQEGAHLGLRLLQGDPRPQAGLDLKVADRPRALGPPAPERHPGLADVRVLEARRHDADHPVRLAAGDHLAADDAGIAPEAALPEAVAEEDHRRSARPVLHGREAAPEDRSDPEERKQVGRDGVDLDLLRPLGTRQRHAPAAAVGGHPLEDGALVLQVHVVQVRPGAVVALDERMLRREGDDPLRLHVGEGPEEEAVEHAEDGDVDPDPERHGEHGNGREPRALEEQPESEAEILAQRVQGTGLPGCGGLRTGRRSPDCKRVELDEVLAQPEKSVYSFSTLSRTEEVKK